MGDMLYRSFNKVYPMRIQSAFVQQSETEAIVESLKINGNPIYEDDILNSSIKKR